MSELYPEKELHYSLLSTAELNKTFCKSVDKSPTFEYILTLMRRYRNELIDERSRDRVK